MFNKVPHLLFDSPFSTIDDVQRFIYWYNEPGQIHSEWDNERYHWAMLIMNTKIAEESRNNGQIPSAFPSPNHS